MYFQIKEIILWPRNSQLAPRRLPFELGKVNVISGVSRTGKSAIIPIIDYCLASKGCTIPVETIRRACAWFGVLVATGDTLRLFARREPEQQRATDDMMLVEGDDLEIPHFPTKNATADGIRRLLDELSGLSNLDFGDEASSAFSGRISFRDLAAFNFQPQNVIANPEVLFFKSDSYEHREKLRNIFPYVLGAVTPETLAKQHELRRLEQTLKRKQRELAEAQQISAQWIASLQARVTEARELGLITKELPPNPSREALIDILSSLVRRSDATLAVSAMTIDGATREAAALEREETSLSTALSRLRQRLTEMNRVRDGANTYAGALKVQRNRLKLSEWLAAHSPASCPVCGGEQRPAQRILDELTASLAEVERSAKSFDEVPATFDRELQRVRTEIAELSDQLEAVRIRRTALSKRSDAARAEQYRARQADRFLGQTENALELYSRLGQDSELRDDVQRLGKEVARLRTEVKDDEISRRIERAIAQVDTNASRILPKLDAERPEIPIRLDIRDLTIKIIGADRVDFLSEVGSGSNWLSYHIAVLLALHRFFLTQPRSPVPGFLVIDQPSQVYFPRKLAVRKDEDIPEPELEDDDDIAAVRRIFEAMADAVGATNGRLQLIVLDHAPETVWGGHELLYQAAEWRKADSKLVPPDWLDGQ